MSIYSGFATRQQQQSYDECLEAVLYILQKRVLRFYKGQDTDEDKFISLLNKLHSQMKAMEGHKYLEPKSSRTFEELLVFLKNRQIQGASIQPNKVTEPEENNQPEHKKHPSSHQPLPHSHSNHEAHDSQGRSQKLQVKFNQMEAEQKMDEKRPNTTNNKIRKRISSRSNNSNAQGSQNFIQSPKQFEVQPKEVQSDSKTQRFQFQNILNESASKLVRISRNEPRSYFNSSHQQLKPKKPTTRSRGKDSLDEPSQPSQANEAHDSDVHNLIKGYISRTRKSYIKGFNKKKEEIDQMLRQI